MSEETKALWDKHDALARRQNEHEKELALTGQRVQLLETNMLRQMKDCAEGHASVMSKLDSYAADVRSLAEGHSRRQGAQEVMRWFIPILVTAALAIAGLILTK